MVCMWQYWRQLSHLFCKNKNQCKCINFCLTSYINTWNLKKTDHETLKHIFLNKYTGGNVNISVIIFIYERYSKFCNIKLLEKEDLKTSTSSKKSCNMYMELLNECSKWPGISGLMWTGSVQKSPDSTGNTLWLKYRGGKQSETKYKAFQTRNNKDLWEFERWPAV